MGTCFKQKKKKNTNLTNLIQVFGSPESPNWLINTTFSSHLRWNLRCSCWAKSVARLIWHAYELDCMLRRQITYFQFILRSQGFKKTVFLTSIIQIKFYFSCLECCFAVKLLMCFVDYKAKGKEGKYVTSWQTKPKPFVGRSFVISMNRPFNKAAPTEFSHCDLLTRHKSGQSTIWLWIQRVFIVKEVERIQVFHCTEKRQHCWYTHSNH